MNPDAPRCPGALDLLDRNLRQPMDRDRLAELEAHATECGECAAILAQRTVLGPRVVQLPDRLAPESALWDGIETRLNRKRALRRTLPIGLAAAATLAIVLLTRGAGPEPDALPPGLERQVMALEAAAGELEGALKAGTIRVPDPAVRALAVPLEAIEKAREETRAALRRDPDNTTLHAAYLAAVQRRIDLLRQAGALEAEGGEAGGGTE